MLKISKIKRTIINSAKAVGRFFKNILRSDDTQYPNQDTETRPLPEIPERDQDDNQSPVSCSTNYATPDWACISKAIVLDDVNDSRYKTFLQRFFAYKETHFQETALKILNNSGRAYDLEEVGYLTKLIASLYYREDTSMSFKTALHNGETLANINKYGTTLVPKGRGKGKNWTWAEAAFDAMMIKKSIFPTVWNYGTCLAFAERFNGLGYRSKIGDKGKIELSPYVMSGTTLHDETSKYYGDGQYSKTAREAQLGVGALMKRIEIEESSMAFTLA